MHLIGAACEPLFMRLAEVKKSLGGVLNLNTKFSSVKKQAQNIMAYVLIFIWKFGGDYSN
jgi:hypothetical protein